MSNNNTQRILSYLQLATRSGSLIIGQDRVIEALRKGKKLELFVTTDCADNVHRKLYGYRQRGVCTVTVLPVRRDALLLSRGRSATQIAGLPHGHDLVSPIKTLCTEGGERLE